MTEEYYADDTYQGVDEHETFGADEFDQEEVDGGAREDVCVDSVIFVIIPIIQKLRIH